MELITYKEFIEKLKYKKEEWLKLHEVDSILLKSGEGIYPNWEKMRFLFDNDRIYIKHGESSPYGARLSGMSSLSGDHRTLNFFRVPEGIKVENSNYYPDGFRQPKTGDFVRLSKGVNNVYGEHMIVGIIPNMNSVMVELATPIPYDETIRISFYDPQEFSNKEECMHGDIVEGIYMKFDVNKKYKNHKKFGPYHQVIRIRDVEHIKLKVGSSFYNKTYPVE